MTSSAWCSNSRRLAPSSRAAKSPLAGPRTPNRIPEEVSTETSLPRDGNEVVCSTLMARRLAPIRDSVHFELDGETIEAERGEPVAFALWAADKVALARSPKLHRPHGPYCLRGGCDGCLARVDGEPNVMTCMVPCQGGERVETQNVLGSRQIDLLRVTDWFFPHGLDHHHFLAGVPAASFVMQKIARHVAGLGRLPDATLASSRANVREVDVLVVGGGPAGLAV